MRRETWDKVGPFNESFRFHVDTEWLGRFNRLGLKRVHLLHQTADLSDPWLNNVKAYSDLVLANGLQQPLVDRLVNAAGGMGQIASQAQAQSELEHQQMIAQFGAVPW